MAHIENSLWLSGLHASRCDCTSSSKAPVIATGKAVDGPPADWNGPPQLQQRPPRPPPGIGERTCKKKLDVSAENIRVSDAYPSIFFLNMRTLKEGQPGLERGVSRRKQSSASKAASVLVTRDEAQ